MTLAALCLALIPVVGLSADLKGTLLISDNTSAILRPTIGVDNKVVEGKKSLDLSNSPAGLVTFGWRHSHLDFGYSPRYTLRDAFSEDQSSLFFNTAFISYTFAGKRYSWSISENGTFGQLNYAGLLVPAALTMPAPGGVGPAPAPPTGLAVFPNGGNLLVGSEQTSVGLGLQHTARFSSSYFASYGISGGLDEASRELLPVFRVATVGAAAAYQVGRVDTLIGTGSIARSDSSTNHTAYLVQSLAWNHRWGKAISTTLGFGLSEGWTRQADGTWAFSGVSPVLTAGIGGGQGFYLIRRRHFALILTLGAGAAPAPNVLSGKLQPTMQGIGLLSAVVDKTTVAASGSVGQTLPPIGHSLEGTDSVRVVSFGLSATHSPSKLVDISAGYRRTWQYVANELQAENPQQWSAYVSLTLRAPPMKF